MSHRSQLTQGAIAGLAGAALMATWFIVIDTATRQPLFTFSFVTQLLFGANSGAVFVGLYIILHFAVFAVVGALFNRMLTALRINPTLPLGAAVGLLLFDVVFYVGVWIIGTNIVQEVGWPVVLTGNIVAGLGIAGYLRVAQGRPIIGIQSVLQEHHSIREGLVAGIVGAVVVAGWFFLLDVAHNRPFFTPAALGAAFFTGASQVSSVEIEPGIVVAYTIAHIIAFALVGLIAARLIAEAEAHPPLLLALVLLFVTLEVLSLGVLAAVAVWLFETVPWWAVIIANFMGAVAMAGYLWRRHPVLQQYLLHTQVEETLYQA